MSGTPPTGTSPTAPAPIKTTFEQMRELVNKYTLQFYQDKATMMGDSTASGAGTMEISITNFGVSAPPLSTELSGPSLPNAIYVKGVLEQSRKDFETDATAFQAKFPYSNYTTQDATVFINGVLKEPIKVLLYVYGKNATKWDGAMFKEKTGSFGAKLDDQDIFDNILAYYLNLNKIWQRVFNAIKHPYNTSSPTVTPNAGQIYKYTASPLGVSDFDVTNFRPWNTFGSLGFGTNLNLLPFGGGALPTNCNASVQTGGAGQQCGEMVKRVVNAVIGAHSNLIDDAAKKDITTKLDESIRVETLINQKLQQIIAISRQSPVNNVEITQYIDGLKKLLDALSASQGLLYDTLRTAVATSGIVKIPTQTNYVDIATLLGGNGTGDASHDQIMCLLNKIAAKLDIK